MDATVADHELAARLAREAGRELMACQAAGGVDLGPRGDRLSHELLMARLAEHAVHDAVLSEEGADSTERLSAARVWIVDPLDGTREFSEGRDDWAVHVALAVDGELAAGAVALPSRDLVLSTATPPTVPAAGGSPKVVVSRTRAPEFAAAVAETLGAELVPLGSAGAKTMAVVLGEADAYVHAGGQYEWDSAAPVAVARAAGLHVSRIDGSALAYNQPHPWLPDLVVCRPELAGAILAVTAPYAE